MNTNHNENLDGTSCNGFIIRSGLGVGAPADTGRMPRGVRAGRGGVVII